MIARNVRKGRPLDSYFASLSKQIFLASGETGTQLSGIK
jgi:hypothetical protein